MARGHETPAPEAEGGHWLRVHRRAMACRFEVTLSDADASSVPAAHTALATADRLEDLWSIFRETSVLSAVNRQAGRGPVAVDAETFDLLRRCRALHEETHGAFDVTSMPLSRCWGFLARDGRVPTDEAIAAARALVGMTAVDLDPATRSVRFERDGMALNLASIGKGAAAEAIAHALRRDGVRHALVSAAGSSIVAVGGRGAGWAIDVCSRQVAGGRLARLHLRDAAMATSGAGEQFVDAGGRRYGHVIDPRSGWPAAGLLSVSVVARDGATADALATAVLVAGPDLARRYCETHPDTLVVLAPEGASHARFVGHHPGARLDPGLDPLEAR